MIKQALEIKTGDVLRVEYGDYDNWVNFTIDRVERLEKMICMKGHHGKIVSDLCFGLNEKVEVLEHE